MFVRVPCGMRSLTLRGSLCPERTAVLVDAVFRQAYVGQNMPTQRVEFTPELTP